MGLPGNFMKVIELKRMTTFLGRNGTFKCTGLIISGYHDAEKPVINIQPVTSYAKPGRARISFPMKDVDKVIKNLVKIKEEHQRYKDHYEARKRK